MEVGVSRTVRFVVGSGCGVSLMQGGVSKPYDREKEVVCDPELQ